MAIPFYAWTDGAGGRPARTVTTSVHCIPRRVSGSCVGGRMHVLHAGDRDGFGGNRAFRSRHRGKRGRPTSSDRARALTLPSSPGPDDAGMFARHESAASRSPSLAELGIPGERRCFRLTDAQPARVKPLGTVVTHPDGAIVRGAGEAGPLVRRAPASSEGGASGGAPEDHVTTHHAGEFSARITFSAAGARRARAGEGPPRRCASSPTSSRVLLQTDLS